MKSLGLNEGIHNVKIFMQRDVTSQVFANENALIVTNIKQRKFSKSIRVFA